jgi:lysophospholipase L1-like esterase
MEVVLYGDSNTYGLMPEGGRYENRYSKILSSYFDKKVNIYEEGLIGRTTIYKDYRPNRKAIDDIDITLSKYKNIDLFVIMLGTNDYKISNARNAKELKKGMNKLLTKINSNKNIKKILVISPILLSENISNLDKEFDYDSYLLSKESSAIYKKLANNYNALFFDAKQVAKAGSDGEHFDEYSHQALANNLIKIIESI